MNWPGSVCLGAAVICHKCLQSTLKGRTHFPTNTGENSHISEPQQTDLCADPDWLSRDAQGMQSQVNPGIPLISRSPVLSMNSQKTRTLQVFHLFPCCPTCDQNKHPTWTSASLQTKAFLRSFPLLRCTKSISFKHLPRVMFPIHQFNGVFWYLKRNFIDK